MPATHLAFALRRSAVRDRVLIPKFYDPDLDEAARLARGAFELVPLAELLEPGEQGSRLGDWIRRDLYGTGTIPYVRTSDLSHWRIRPDYKKGVSRQVYEQYAARQSVRPGDLLMVAHGTYLVGNVAAVTEDEPELVLQDHVFRLRVREGGSVDSMYLLAALSTAFVRRQVRARQFSADIIDKIGTRHLSLLVPIHRDAEVRSRVAGEVRAILTSQSLARTKIRELTGSDLRMTRERAEARLGYGVARGDVRRRVLIPKYYDPAVEEALADAERADSVPWQTIGELVAERKLDVNTGVEVGKMAYGTGPIPFIRTSDIADLELKRDVRHGVSEAFYESYQRKAGLQAGDVILVRDGTYLVGSSALVSESDLPALCCGGIYRIRPRQDAGISPHALLAALNLPVVRRQMRARQFTRDVIDTLGNRLSEVRLPSLSSPRAAVLAEDVRAVMEAKNTVKAQIGSVVRQIEPPAPPILAGRPSWSMR
jgi:hypothetical protein